MGLDDAPARTTDAPRLAVAGATDQRSFSTSVGLGVTHLKVALSHPSLAVLAQSNGMIYTVTVKDSTGRVLGTTTEAPIVLSASMRRSLFLALSLSGAVRSATGSSLWARAAEVETSAQAAFLSMIARTLKEGGALRSAWESLGRRGLELLSEWRDPSTNSERYLAWARLAVLFDRFEVLEQGALRVHRWLGHDPAAVAILREVMDTRAWDRAELKVRAVVT